MKKVLIISYYWPPAGGPGALRVVKFVKYLSQFGWQPVILTAKNGEFPYIDLMLDAEVPPDVTIYRAANWEPFVLYKKFTGKAQKESIPVGFLTHRKKGLKEKLASTVRANLFVPDARIGWIPFATKTALEIIDKEKIDLIFISSPPHSSQLIGTKLKKKTGIHWIADLRDPWTDIRYYEFIKRWKIAVRLDRRYERRVLEQCDFITTVSRDLVRMFDEKSESDIAGKSLVLPNGFDEDDFENRQYAPHPTFDIVHTGNMQDHQNPVVLWKVLKLIMEDNPEYRNIIRAHLVGRTHPEIQAQVEEMNLGEYVEFQPFRPHREILPVMANADLLLMVIPRVKNNMGIVTGKFFEYLGADRPVLVIGPPESDASSMVKAVDGSRVVDYEDENGLLEYLRQSLKKWKKGELFFDNREYTRQFSRRALTEKLSGVFDKIITMNRN